jgi:hypothetical protein
MSGNLGSQSIGNITARVIYLANNPGQLVHSFSDFFAGHGLLNYVKLAQHLLYFVAARQASAWSATSKPKGRTIKERRAK